MPPSKLVLLLKRSPGSVESVPMLSLLKRFCSRWTQRNESGSGELLVYVTVSFR
jgi:hypothetical protein